MNKVQLISLGNSYRYLSVLILLLFTQSCFISRDNVLDRNPAKGEYPTSEDVQELSSLGASNKFLMKDVEQAYQAINDTRINYLKSLSPDISYSYRDVNSADRFYNTINTDRNSWLFYASEIKLNQKKSSLTSFVKETRYEEMRRKWLYLMNSKFQRFLVKSQESSLCENATTFVDPSGKMNNITSFLTVKKSGLSSKCNLYIKPPTTSSYSNLNAYKVTKMFSDRANDCTFIELKLKSKVAIVYLYLKSERFDVKACTIPQGKVIFTEAFQPSKK